MVSYYPPAFCASGRCVQGMLFVELWVGTDSNKADGIVIYEFKNCAIVASNIDTAVTTVRSRQCMIV